MSEPPETQVLAKMPTNAPPKNFDPRKLLEQLPELLEVADAAKAAEDKLNRKLNATWRLMALVARKVGVSEAEIAAAQAGK
jgi:hypothetical protein